jgi:cation diffusion facilitator family transporter
MASCCEDKSCEITSLVNKHRKVLQVVLVINALMFLVEGIAGSLAHSTSLMADALDMFGDALVYGLSIYVISENSKKQAQASMVKGWFMLFFAVVVLGEAAYKILNPVIPDATTIGVIGAIALMANLVCFFMLYTHREDNLNMSSTWLCSRNDLIANVGVLFAGYLTHLLASRWPDIIIGILIAGLFLKSSIHVIRQARHEMSKPDVSENEPVLISLGMPIIKKADKVS